MNVTPKFSKVAHHFDQDCLRPYIIKEVTEASLARLETDKGVVLKSKIYTKYLKHYRSSEDISAVTDRQALQPLTQLPDAADIEDEDDEEVNLRELDTMEGSTQAEDDIDNLFQDDVLRHRVQISNISSCPLFLGGKGRSIGVRIH